MSLNKTIETLWNGHRTVRVALMGTQNSGKTVFLTAIANHLRNHSPDNFNLGGIRVGCRGVPASPGRGDFPRFDATTARQAFARGEWPAKTTEPSLLALSLTLADTGTGKREDVLLEILDIPGERIADFPMMGRNYREWCSWLQTAWNGPDDAIDTYRRYLDRVQGVDPGGRDAVRSALFAAYRDFLAESYANHAAHVSPSTVKLEWDGTPHGGPSKEAFLDAIRDVPLGIRAADGRVREFVPLPCDAFDRKSPWRPLAGEFSKAYDIYAKKVVRPLERWLHGATTLVYLVDVLTLLKSGPQAWFAEKSYGEAAIRMLCPRRGGNLIKRWGTRLWGLLVQTEIRRVRIVAGKADLVLAGDRDNLGKLAEDLFGNVLDASDARASVCAAVSSTEQVTVDQEGTPVPALRGKVDSAFVPAGSGDTQIWFPSPVPPSPPATACLWQSRIDEGAFNYPSTFPVFNPYVGIPPEHLGLNSLVRDILAR